MHCLDCCNTYVAANSMKHAYVFYVNCPIFLSHFNRIWIFLTDFLKGFQCQILQKSIQWEPCSYTVPTRGRKPVQITGAEQYRRGHGARLCCICFVFLSHIIICPSHSATESQSFQFSVKIFSWSARVGVGLNPL
jgi:hypothetical protein